MVPNPDVEVVRHSCRYLDGTQDLDIPVPQSNVGNTIKHLNVNKLIYDTIHLGYIPELVLEQGLQPSPAQRLPPVKCNVPISSPLASSNQSKAVHNIVNSASGSSTIPGDINIRCRMTSSQPSPALQIPTPPSSPTPGGAPIRGHVTLSQPSPALQFSVPPSSPAPSGSPMGCQMTPSQPFPVLPTLPAPGDSPRRYRMVSSHPSTALQIPVPRSAPGNSSIRYTMAPGLPSPILQNSVPFISPVPGNARIKNKNVSSQPASVHPIPAIPTPGSVTMTCQLASSQPSPVLQIPVLPNQSASGDALIRYQMASSHLFPALKIPVPRTSPCVVPTRYQIASSQPTPALQIPVPSTPPVAGNVPSRCQMAATRPPAVHNELVNFARPRAPAPQNGHTRFSIEALQHLNNWFNANRWNPYPDEETLEMLGTICNITVAQVKKWFSNKRMRSK